MNINESLKSIARPIQWFKPDPKNARKHSSRNIRAIADSLRMFGQQKPIVALADGTVIAGNGTLEAAKSIGMTDLACVVFADAEMARAFAIADNRTAEMSEWDDSALRASLDEITARGIDAVSVGFDDFSPREAIKMAKLADIDVSDLVDARFKLTVSGPLKDQHEVLAALNRFLTGMSGLHVEMSVNE